MLDAIIGFADAVVVRISPVINNLVAALLIVFLGFIAGKLLGQILRKILRDAKADRYGKKVLRRETPITRVVSTAASWAVYAAAVVWALDVLDVAYLVGLLVLAGIIGLALLSLVLVIRDLLPNVMARRETRLAPGSYLRSPVQGRVRRQGWLDTIVERDGEVFVIPNRLLRRSP